MSLKTITVTVNGEAYERTVAMNRTLLDFLRNELYLTGTKEGCNEGECGACTVLLDDKPVNSCMVLAVEAHNKEVLTVEGLAKDGELHPLQKALIDAGAVQCGYCIPGILMSAVALLDRYPNPTREQIRRGIEGNICRCGGYEKIIDAIGCAAAAMKNNRRDWLRGAGGEGKEAI